MVGHAVFSWQTRRQGLREVWLPAQSSVRGRISTQFCLASKLKFSPRNAQLHFREGFSDGETQEKEQPSKPLTSELSQKKEGAATGQFLRQEWLRVRPVWRQEEACMAGVGACHMIAGPSAKWKCKAFGSKLIKTFKTASVEHWTKCKALLSSGSGQEQAWLALR